MRNWSTFVPESDGLSAMAHATLYGEYMPLPIAMTMSLTACLPDLPYIVPSSNDESNSPAF
eukprot:scaffold137056_cov35-Attheya_sp.AAC.1